jgi:hypothetical protein
MLDHWGYIFLGIGTALGYIEVDLQNHRKSSDGDTIDPSHPVAQFVKGKCDEILKLSRGIELGAIPQNVRVLEVKFLRARNRLQGKPIYTDDLLEEVTRIKNDFLYILSKRFFYYLPHDMEQFYGQPQLFGEAVARKFKNARDDIERAGNCLALGESTACVMHLGRALESAIRHLARRLNVQVSPRDTWGVILNGMKSGIEAMPEKTEREKKKKGQWAECRSNLFDLKMAWRDDSMHAKAAYDLSQAKQIMSKVDAFMRHLATL